MGSNLGSDREPKFTRHVQDVFPTIEELLDAGDEVQSLLTHPGFAHVTRLLDAEVATIDRKLDGSNEPLSQAEYAMAHGRRGGLRGVADAAGALLRRADVVREEQRRKHETPGETGGGS